LEENHRVPLEIPEVVLCVLESFLSRIIWLGFHIPPFFHPISDGTSSYHPLYTQPIAISNKIKTS
jgi:hypothetical protein